MSEKTPEEMIRNKPTIEKRVKLILEEYPPSRGDDVLLQYRYLRAFTPVRLSFHAFKQLLFIPSPESITRARRKIQAQEANAHLRPTKRVRHKREGLEGANAAYYAQDPKQTQLL
jgi:uncharacterized protein (DUF58 family)